MDEAERTARIVAAAASVIAREGVERASIRRIAEEAEVPLGLIHYAFGSKRELFAAVYAHWFDASFAAVPEWVAPGAGVERAARTIAERIVDWADAQPGAAAGHYELLLWAHRAAPDLAADTYRRWVASWTVALERGAAPGTTSERIHEVRDLLLVGVDGAVVRLLATRDRDDAHAVLDRALRILERAGT